MILSVTAIDRHQQWRSFFCQVDELEVAFDILNSIVQHGDQPLKASISDESSRIDLPIEAFGEQTMAEPIRQLKREWELILTPPVEQAKEERAPQPDWFPRLLALRQRHIDQLEDSISRMRQLMLFTKKSMLKGALKTRLINRQQETIDRYTSALARAQAAYSALLFPIE